jgi:hypothetical protein
MRNAPLLRAMVTISERKTVIATALIEADEKASQKLSSFLQTDSINLCDGSVFH